MVVGSLHKFGARFWSPYNKDHNVFGSTLWLPLYGNPILHGGCEPQPDDTQVRATLTQLLQQLKVLQALGCTHTEPQLHSGVPALRTDKALWIDKTRQ